MEVKIKQKHYEYSYLFSNDISFIAENHYTAPV